MPSRGALSLLPHFKLRSEPLSPLSWQPTQAQVLLGPKMLVGAPCWPWSGPSAGKLRPGGCGGTCPRPQQVRRDALSRACWSPVQGSPEHPPAIRRPLRLGSVSMPPTPSLARPVEKQCPTGGIRGGKHWSAQYLLTPYPRAPAAPPSDLYPRQPRQWWCPVDQLSSGSLGRILGPRARTSLMQQR